MFLGWEHIKVMRQTFNAINPQTLLHGACRCGNDDDDDEYSILSPKEL